MADELTSLTQAPTTPNEPGQSQASPAEPQSSPSAEPGQQTPEPKKQSVNLYELPEFKEYQRQVSKTMTDYQRRMQELEQRQHEAAMSSMTPDQKLAYQLQLKDQEIERYRQHMQQQEIDKQRQADIRKLTELSGAPASVFEAAETYEEATMLAMQYMREHSPASVAAQQAKVEANRVDLGGAAASTPIERDQREARALLEKGDTKAFFLHMLEN